MPNKSSVKDASVFTIAIETSFNFLSVEFAELFASSVATAFQSPLWLASFYKRLPAASDAEPLVVSVRDADGRLVMLLPLVRRRVGGVLVVEFADLRVSDYLSPVADRASFARLASDKQFRQRLRRAIKPFDTVRVTKLPHDGLALEDLLGARERAPMGMHAYAVPLGNDYATWREANMAASYRKELDKKARQLERRGEVDFACLTDPDEIRTAFDALKLYRGIRFGDTPGGEVLQIPHYFDFYLEVATKGAGVEARTYQLSVDGRPIAVVLGLAHQGTCLVIMGGFDHASFKNQSIGALTFEGVARDCIAQGDRLLDFTIGDEPYKVTFGATPTPMWSVTSAGSPLGTLAGLAVDNLPWVKAIAKRLFSAPHRHGEATRSTQGPG